MQAAPPRERASAGPAPTLAQLAAQLDAAGPPATALQAQQAQQDQQSEQALALQQAAPARLQRFNLFAEEEEAAAAAKRANPEMEVRFEGLWYGPHADAVLRGGRTLAALPNWRGLPSYCFCAPPSANLVQPSRCTQAARVAAPARLAVCFAGRAPPTARQALTVLSGCADAACAGGAAGRAAAAGQPRHADQRCALRRAVPLCAQAAWQRGAALVGGEASSWPCCRCRPWCATPPVSFPSA